MIERSMPPLEVCTSTTPTPCELGLLNTLEGCIEDQLVLDVERRRASGRYAILSAVKDEPPKLESVKQSLNDILIWVLPPIFLAAGIFLGSKL